MTEHHAKPRLFSPKTAALILLTAVVFGGMWAAGWYPRKARVAAITEQAQQDNSSLLAVTVAKAAPAPALRELVLPGTVSALLDTPVYARAEGYLRVLRADIGDVVKKGQILVELETPELDQSLRAAKSRIEQLRAGIEQSKAAQQKSQADVKLAEVTRKRVSQLVTEGVVSKQQGDDADAQYDVRLAELQSAKAAVGVAEQNLKAQEAEVARLEELSSFKQVRAPFDGIVTLRNAATGNMVTPNAANGGRELFRMANFDVLRVFVAVPQANVPDIQPGQTAEVYIGDLTGRRFPGKVSRTANALEESTRTQRTEVRVENPQHALLPGMYVQVKFLEARPRSLVVIPGDTLLTRADGLYVAVVGPNNTIHMQKILMGRDLGPQVEVVNGLSGDELLVVNPSDAVKTGVPVRPLPRK